MTSLDSQRQSAITATPEHQPQDHDDNNGTTVSIETQYCHCQLYQLPKPTSTISIKCRRATPSSSTSPQPSMYDYRMHTKDSCLDQEYAPVTTTFLGEQSTFVLTRAYPCRCNRLLLSESTEWLIADVVTDKLNDEPKLAIHAYMVHTERACGVVPPNASKNTASKQRRRRPGALPHGQSRRTYVPLRCVDIAIPGCTRMGHEEYDVDAPQDRSAVPRARSCARTVWVSSKVCNQNIIAAGRWYGEDICREERSRAGIRADDHPSTAKGCNASLRRFELRSQEVLEKSIYVEVRVNEPQKLLLDPSVATDSKADRGTDTDPDPAAAAGRWLAEMTLQPSRTRRGQER